MMLPRFALPVVTIASLLLAACSSPPASPGGPAATEDPPVIEGPPPATPDPAPTTPTPTPVKPACTASVPRDVPLEVAVLPDAGATPFVSVLERAKRTIRVMVYEMGTGPILDALEAKARAGVKVQVILDVGKTDVNAKYKTRLEAAGATVLWSDPQFSYMHAKVLIVDEAEAVISTGNYADFRMKIERNYAVHDSDAADVDALVKLFDADFGRKAPDLTCTRLLVSPVNAKQRLLDFIATAKTEILVESMQLADTDVREALAKQKAAGVTVRVILADPSWITANTEAAAFLGTNAIEARQMKVLAVHVKAIVIDGKTAYAGSENLSWTSLTKNREVGVIVTEPANAAAMQATFEKDWLTATAF